MKAFSFFRAVPHLRPDDLTRLAAHDLPERRAQVVRRHLAACPICRAEWRAVQNLWQSASALQENLSLPVTSDTLRERIWAALPPPAPRVPERKPSMPLIFVRPVVGASLVAASVAAALGVGLLYGPSLVFRAPRAVAFSDIEAAMGGIKNATWTTQATITFAPSASRRNVSQPIQQRKSESYMQTKPPRIATREPAYRTGEQGDNRRKKSVYFGKYMLSFTEGGRNYSQYDTADTMSREKSQTAEEMVRRAVLFPRELLSVTTPSQEEKSPTNEVLAVVEKSPWVSTPDTLDGEKVVRLQNRITRTYPVSKHRKKVEKQEEENTVWADPDTYRIVRREAHILPLFADGPDIKIVYRDYRYNIALPPGVFDVPIPPVGQPFVFHKYTGRPDHDGRVSPADTAKIKAKIERAARLWNTKQVDKLVQNWDFGFNSTWAEMSGGKSATPTEIVKEKRQWVARMRSGVPYKAWQLQDLTVAKQLGGGGIYVREKQSDPFPPTGRPVNYAATCDVMAVLKPNTKPVPCSMTATFHRVGNDFRITYLNMYDHQMGTGNGIAWRPKTQSKP